MINSYHERNSNSENKDNTLIMYIVEKWKKRTV